jgi:hypothetical protein
MLWEMDFLVGAMLLVFDVVTLLAHVVGRWVEGEQPSVATGAKPSARRSDSA